MAASGKRSFSFTDDDGPQVKLTRGGDWSMPDYTPRSYTQVLMGGGGGGSGGRVSAAPEPMERTEMCGTCSRAALCHACAFCGHPVCGSCLRQCEACCDLFCNVCSTMNFDASFDRLFCLTCNDSEQQRQADSAAHSMLFSRDVSSSSSGWPVTSSSFFSGGHERSSSPVMSGRSSPPNAGSMW